MLTLNVSNIQLNQQANDKQDAIKALASALTQRGLVDDGYVNGMLAREKQNSTYLGNGIAIPHGTVDTRDLVKQTGVVVHHFPQGVPWGDDNTVYVAIGIAAKSDEHLGILKQLTRVLSSDGIEALLKSIKSADELIALLNGEVQLDADFDPASIRLSVPATDMLQLVAIAAGLLSQRAVCDAHFVANLLTKPVTHLGRGLWLVGSEHGVKRTALAFATTANAFDYSDHPVKGLIAIAGTNNAHGAILDRLATLVANNEQDALLNNTAENIVALLNGEATTPVDAGATGTFRIRNAHGLHARPGAMLVAEAKKFNADIRVANLDGDGKVVNAKSLMKVIALGVKHGHQLQFTADGDDAQAAIDAIGQAIEAGLGEG
ncbi:fused PTS fructose transporter subunit IIA/HPr protein [Vibrio sp. SM6]|uniref:Multiphosphoryl transfer protein n=1 Tax=Vibrio agarilyticus TaxID=2726741 RepID=A0A7X8TR87_9VIBR|nr:fused PTS fructose transporter subunit IIA/HPr protein [Vibrio agarilyticus]NLS13304.1 fused PTS fructose transporter subunit IIA/HPr protein [Vibrio agarilyticus]